MSAQIQPVDPIEECVRLAQALEIERQWVALLTRDNGLLLQAADATKAGSLAISQAGRIEHLERENAALRRDVYQCPPTSENDYEGFKWSDVCEELERENAALLTYKANTTIRITALEKENAMWVQTVDRLLKEAKS